MKKSDSIVVQFVLLTAVAITAQLIVKQIERRVNEQEQA